MLLVSLRPRPVCVSLIVRACAVYNVGLTIQTKVPIATTSINAPTVLSSPLQPFRQPEARSER